MHAEAWEPIDGICGPCGQISFSYIPANTATVVMAFHGVAGSPSRNLTLDFKRVFVLCGEDECPGGFVTVPKQLPKLGRGDHPAWTFPLLKLVDSEPLKQYEHYGYKDQPMAHFFLVSLHNLVHVIASADVNATWSPPLSMLLLARPATVDQ
jgi:hypothetical protein